MTGHTVAIVFDPDVGLERLSELVRKAHVWLIGTPANRAVAKQFWAEQPKFDLASGITTFDAQGLEELLRTVDEHHGQYSSDPPYARLEVVGEMLSDAILSEVKAIGLGRIEPNDEGFVATR